jgi:poly-gamma-glutamate biosynthesis protein PgsC/CapC
MVTLFVIGVIVALLVERACGYTPGGVIVPGFLAIALSDPAQVVVTLAVAVATLGIFRLVEPHIVLYGRNRFGFFILSGVVIKMALVTLLPKMGLQPYGLLVIGYLIPGITANAFARQGIVPTLGALAAAVAIARLLFLAVLGW